MYCKIGVCTSAVRSALRIGATVHSRGTSQTIWAIALTACRRGQIRLFSFSASPAVSLGALSVHLANTVTTFIKARPNIGQELSTIK